MPIFFACASTCRYRLSRAATPTPRRSATSTPPAEFVTTAHILPTTLEHGRRNRHDGHPALARHDRFDPCLAFVDPVGTVLACPATALLRRSCPSSRRTFSSGCGNSFSSESRTHVPRSSLRRASWSSSTTRSPRRAARRATGAEKGVERGRSRARARRTLPGHPASGDPRRRPDGRVSHHTCARGRGVRAARRGRQHGADPCRAQPDRERWQPDQGRPERVRDPRLAVLRESPRASSEDDEEE